MARGIVLGVALVLSAVTGLGAQRMEISTTGSRPPLRGASENFTGTVSVTAPIAAAEGMHATGAQNSTVTTIRRCAINEGQV